MEEKSCNNCKNFIQHYCKMDTRILKVNCGHCVYKKKPLPCDKWDKIEDTTIQDKQKILSAIKRMCKRINDISLYLSDSPEYTASFVDNSD